MAFFGDFERAVNDLKGAGAKVTEKEKLNYMLNTLPESYSYIGDLIDTLKVEDQTADYVENKIRMAELKNQKDENSVKRSNVFAANKSIKEKICYSCGGKGHFRRQCKNGGQASGGRNTWRAPRGW